MLRLPREKIEGSWRKCNLEHPLLNQDFVFEEEEIEENEPEGKEVEEPEEGANAEGEDEAGDDESEAVEPPPPPPPPPPPRGPYRTYVIYGHPLVKIS